MLLYKKGGILMKSGYFFNLSNGKKIDVATRINKNDLGIIEPNQIVLIRNTDLIKTHLKNYSMFFALGYRTYPAY